MGWMKSLETQSDWSPAASVHLNHPVTQHDREAPPFSGAASLSPRSVRAAEPPQPPDGPFHPQVRRIQLLNLKQLHAFMTRSSRKHSRKLAPTSREGSPRAHQTGNASFINKVYVRY